MPVKQKGATITTLVLVIVGLLVIGGGVYYYLYQKKGFGEKSTPLSEVKQETDNSAFTFQASTEEKKQLDAARSADATSNSIQPSQATKGTQAEFMLSLFKVLQDEANK